MGQMSEGKNCQFPIPQEDFGLLKKLSLMKGADC